MNGSVSIIVPIYNMENSLEKNVSSLLKQSYGNIEIILIDDGSTDGSFAKCCELEKKDTRVRCYHTENRGSGPARNLGISKSNGDYLYFPDADDYLDHNAIAKMLNATMGGECDLVVFGFRYVNQKEICVKIKTYEDSIQIGDRIRSNYSEYMEMERKWGIQGAPWNKLFKRDVVVKNNLEYPPLRRHQDEGFISRYMCYATKVHFIPDILYTYCINDLKKVWQKYPVDYIESVTGLYALRKQTILTWNNEDKLTQNIVDISYVNNFIQALELSYSPRMQVNGKERAIWVEKNIQKYKFDSFPKPNGLGKYQKILCYCIDAKKVHLAMMIMKIKVGAQMLGLVTLLKSIRR